VKSGNRAADKQCVWLRFLSAQILRAVLITLIAGLFGAVLVRFSPGFDSDERDLDMRLSAATHRADARARAAEHDVLAFYVSWLGAAAHGEFGQSRSMNRPVRELLAERLPVTARLMAAGGLLGLVAGLLGAGIAVGRRSRIAENILGPGSGLLLSAPPAVTALLLLWLDYDPALAIAIAVCPYVFRYAFGLLRESASALHVTGGRARGVGEVRLFFSHILLPVAPQLASVATISAAVAFGAAIPVEVICDRAGVGQLAWQAALGRDMPVLVAVTLLITLMIVAVNAFSEVVLVMCSREPRT
jgi:peptide/nickel transport system permease protein